MHRPGLVHQQYFGGIHNPTGESMCVNSP